MMSFKRVFRDAMSHSPMFVRRILTRQKIRKILSYVMPVEETLKCDRDPEYKARCVEARKQKFPERTAWLEAGIDKALERCPRDMVLDESGRQEMRRRMEYGYFGYGFYPDEFMFFKLGGANSELSRLRTYVSVTERWAFRFAANDFTNSLLADKADTYKRFSRYYKRDVIIVDSDAALPEFREFIGKHSRFVYKRVSSSRGDGVELVDHVEEPEAFFRKVRQAGKALLEECIAQSAEIAAFNASSVNTVRVATYNTRSGIRVVHGTFRCGRNGSFIDNSAKGGVFAVHDPQQGRIISTGFDEYGNVYEAHPDSGVRYMGFQFPQWEEAKHICTEIAAELPSYKYISYDLAHTDRGWVVVEINPSGGYAFQTGRKEGFRSELRELIANMDLMVSYSLRDYSEG